MPNFIAFPCTIELLSVKTPAQGIAYAKNYADELQEGYPSTTYLTVTYLNLKTMEFGQIISTRYAEYIKKVKNRAEQPRVHVVKLATVGSLDAGEGADMTIDYDRLAAAVADQIVTELPGSGLTVEDVDRVVSERLEPIKQDITLAVDHARAANMQTKPK